MHGLQGSTAIVTGGSRGLGKAICRRMALQILDEHQPPPLPAGTEAELERIVGRFFGANFHFEA